MYRRQVGFAPAVYAILLSLCPNREIDPLDVEGDGRTDVIAASSERLRVSWAGQSNWETLRYQREGLGEFLFGDFNGDHRADVLVGGVFVRRRLETVGRRPEEVGAELGRYCLSARIRPTGRRRRLGAFSPAYGLQPPVFRSADGRCD